jgi:hypothetical protein
MPKEKHHIFHRHSVVLPKQAAACRDQYVWAGAAGIALAGRFKQKSAGDAWLDKNP